MTMIIKLVLFIVYHSLFEAPQIVQCSRNCAALTIHKSVKIDCYLPLPGLGRRFTNLLLHRNHATCTARTSFPSGTEITFGCAKYYSHEQPKPKSMTCVDGTWDGLGRFNGFKCRIDCGNRLAKPYIVNGNEVHPSKWPWHVSIFKLNNRRYQYHCGGSLVNPMLNKLAVVSAAHCFLGNEGLILYPGLFPQRFKVVVGSSSSSFEEQSNVTLSPYAQIFDVSSIKVYNLINITDPDIAVIPIHDELRREILPNVIPICFGHSEPINVSAKGYVVGFGYIDPKYSSISQTLRETKFDVVYNRHCEHKLRPEIKGEEICAGHKNDQAICQGDSGGGFVFKRKKQINGRDTRRYFIEGVVSQGTNPDCKGYEIFTRVSAFTRWIRHTVYRNP